MCIRDRLYTVLIIIALALLADSGWYLFTGEYLFWDNPACHYKIALPWFSQQGYCFIFSECMNSLKGYLYCFLLKFFLYIILYISTLHLFIICFIKPFNYSWTLHKLFIIYSCFMRHNPLFCCFSLLIHNKYRTCFFLFSILTLIIHGLISPGSQAFRHCAGTMFCTAHTRF